MDVPWHFGRRRHTAYLLLAIRLGRQPPPSALYRSMVASRFSRRSCTDQAYAVNQCAEAVNRLFVACGASAWPRKNPLQRLFRDMNITAAHAYTNYDLCAEAMGRELMGLAPDPAVAPAP